MKPKYILKYLNYKIEFEGLRVLKSTALISSSFCDMCVGSDRIG